MPKSQHVPNLHLNFENFKPQKMDEDPEYKGSYRLFRMIPPGHLQYFFSDKEHQTYTDPYAPVKRNEHQVINAEMETLVVPKINYIEHVEQLKRALTIDDIQSLKPIPRPERPEEERLIRPKSAWTLQKSIFA